LDSLGNPIRFIQTVGGFFEPILRSLTDVFLITNFGPFVAGLLIAVGLVISAALIISVTLTVRRINSARDTVRAAVDANDFAVRFSSIDAAIKGNESVSAPWLSFAAGLSHPDARSIASSTYH